MSKHWAEKDERIPWPMYLPHIMTLQARIMNECFGPIHEDTDVSIEMVEEVNQVIWRRYRPVWLNIVSLN